MPLFTIPCSFGEIVDKATILELKLKKATSEAQRANIQREYDGLKEYLSGLSDISGAALLTDLRKINQRLWILEDMIRAKTTAKAYDKQYIMAADGIHIANDERYRLKRALNALMDSDIVEEKLYKKSDSQNIIETPDDHKVYATARQAFSEGKYEKARRIFDRLCEKFKGSTPNVFVCSLFSTYDTTTCFLGEPNPYTSKIEEFVDDVMTIVPDETHAQLIQLNYGMHLLRAKRYTAATQYMRFANSVTAPGIRPDTMAYFKPDDVGKTLLIYMGGGIGDKIMFGRFIPRICAMQTANNIILLADDSLFWIFSNFVYPNLRVMKFSQRDFIPKYDYHTNIQMLPHWLSLEYDDIYVDYYLKDIAAQTPLTISKQEGMKTVMINWHGNYANSVERLNRGMSLETMTTLLSMKGVRWVSVQQEFTEEEATLLKRYGVTNLGPLVDKGGDAYRDTLALMRSVDLVISTDTSFAHVAGTAGIPCWVLLTKGCEWRWTQDTTTRWYPELRLFRQKAVGEWGPVMSEVRKALGPKV